MKIREFFNFDEKKISLEEKQEKKIIPETEKPEVLKALFGGQEPLYYV